MQSLPPKKLLYTHKHKKDTLYIDYTHSELSTKGKKAWNIYANRGMFLIYIIPKQFSHECLTRTYP